MKNIVVKVLYTCPIVEKIMNLRFATRKIIFFGRMIWLSLAGGGG
jgi:hypothetical protein